MLFSFDAEKMSGVARCAQAHKGRNDVRGSKTPPRMQKWHPRRIRANAKQRDDDTANRGLATFAAPRIGERLEEKTVSRGTATSTPFCAFVAIHSFISDIE